MLLVLLPLTVSYFSKIQIGFTFLVPAHPGSPGQRAVKWVCVCVCVSIIVVHVGWCVFVSAPIIQNAGDYVFTAGGLDNVITMV